MKLCYLLLLSLALAGCASTPPYTAGAQPSPLSACPESYPRCVSSLNAPGSFFIAPIKTGELSSAEVMARLKVALAKEPRTELVFESEHRLEAVSTSSIVSYHDDLSLQFEPAKKQVLLRSSARIGYFDFRVNRKRLERIRAAFAAQ